MSIAGPAWRRISALIAKRLLIAILTVASVSILIFVGTEILPGDVASAILGAHATPESLAAIRQQLNLDEPAVLRYLHWVAGALHGDLGHSLANGQSVSEQLTYRLGNSLFLAATAAIIAIPSAILLGIACAIRPQSAFDKTVNVVALTGTSLPEFLIGYSLILLFAIELGWVPSFSLFNDQMTFLQKLQSIVLPAATLTIVAVAHTLRMTRAIVIRVMSLPFIEMAFLNGFPRWFVVTFHAVPNAIGPIANVVALTLSWLIVGVIVVEVVFVYPGIGQYIVDAVSQRDLPVVQSCGLVFACTFIGLNLLADIVAFLANPRLRSAK